MVKAEVNAGNVEPQVSNRDKVLAGVNKKIAEHPFYTGRNAVFMGLSTPISKNRTEKPIPPDDTFTSTPQDFYLEKFFESKSRSTSPEDMAEELRREKEGQGETVEYADEIFDGSLVVQQDKNAGVRKRKDGGGISWVNQKNWERDWELTGRYIGGDDSLEEIGKSYGITRARAQKIVEEHVEDIEIHFNGRKNQEKPKKSEQKSTALFYRKKQLNNPDSKMSAFLKDLDEGKTVDELNDTYGAGNVNDYRAEFSEFGISVPLRDNMGNSDFKSEFVELSNPETPYDRKKELMSRVSEHRFMQHGSEGMHVIALTKGLRAVGLHIPSKEIAAFIERATVLDPDIYICSVIKRKEKGSYRYISEGDMDRLRKIAENEEFAKYKRPNA